MFNVVLELAVSFLQFSVNLFSLPDLDLPSEEVKDAIHSIQALNIGQTLFTQWFPFLDDIRVYFTALCVLCPLVFCLIGLLALEEKRIVVWYLLLVSGIMMLVAGALGRLLSSTTSELGLSEDDTQFLLYLGGGTTAGMLLMLGLYRMWQCHEDGTKKETSTTTTTTMPSSSSDGRSSATKTKATEQKREEKGEPPLGSDRCPSTAAAGTDAAQQLEQDDTDNNNSSNKNNNKQMEGNDDVAPCNFWSSFQALLLWIVFGAAGVFSLGIVFPEVLHQPVEDLGTRLSLALAIASFFFFAIFFVWFWMSVFECGRRKQNRFHDAVSAHIVRLLLLTLSLLYIPICTGIFTLFNCSSFDCPDGYRLPDKGSLVVANQSQSSSSKSQHTDFCIRCEVAANQTCPSTFAATLCRASSSERLEYSLSTECAEVQTFFWPAAGVAALMFAVGVPAMFYYLIRLSSNLLVEKFVVEEEEEKGDKKEEDEGTEKILFDDDGATNEDVTKNDNSKTNHNLDEAEIEKEKKKKQQAREEAQYKQKVNTSKNVANFLAQPFHYRCRMARLFQLFQKLFIVGTTTFVIRSRFDTPQTFALCFAIAIHSISTIVLTVTTPFVHPHESYLAIAMSAILTATSVVALLMSRGTSMPLEVVWSLGIVSVVLPVVAIGIGVFLEVRMWCSKREQDSLITNQRVKELHQSNIKQIKDTLAASGVQMETDHLAGTWGATLTSSRRSDNKEGTPTQPTETTTGSIDNPNGSAKVEVVPDDPTVESAKSPLVANASSSSNPTPNDPKDEEEEEEEEEMEAPAESLAAPPVDASPFTVDSNEQQDESAPAPPTKADSAVAPLNVKILQRSSSAAGRRRESSVVVVVDDPALKNPLTAASSPNSTVKSPPPPLVKERSQDTAPAAASSGELLVFSPLGQDDDDDHNRPTTAAAPRNNNDNNNDNSNNDHHTPTRQTLKRTLSLHFSPKRSYSLVDLSNPETLQKLHDESLAHSTRQARDEIDAKKTALEEKQAAVDNVINKEVQSSVIVFLMVGGGLGFAALALCLLGLLSDRSMFLAAVTGGGGGTTATIHTQLAGYQNWTDFTAHCCCTANQNPSPLLSSSSSASGGGTATTSLSISNRRYVWWVEKWICESGRVQERVRKVAWQGLGSYRNETIPEDGLRVRGFCDPTFRLGCEVVVSSTSGAVGLWCSNSSDLTAWW